MSFYIIAFGMSLYIIENFQQHWGRGGGYVTRHDPLDVRPCPHPNPKYGSYPPPPYQKKAKYLVCSQEIRKNRGFME